MKIYRSVKSAKITPRKRAAYNRDLHSEASWAETQNYKDQQLLRNRLIQVAMDMKTDNEPIEKIMKYTDLSRDEIERL
jgi:hypothetical protein